MEKLNIQIASDLHLDIKPYNKLREYIIPSSKNLVLAGDIGNIYEFKQLKNILFYVCSKFENVIYVFGNQEFYTKKNKINNTNKEFDYFNKYKYLPKTFNQLVKSVFYIKEKYKLDNLHILDRSYVIIDRVMFLGAILWSDLKVELPEYFRIYDIDTNIYKEMHKRDVNYIKNIIKNFDNYKDKCDRICVVTHYPPILQTEKNDNDNYYSMYNSDLSDIMNGNIISTWIFGHTHVNVDKYINGTRVISNQKGSNKNFADDYKNDMTIDV